MHFTRIITSTVCALALALSACGGDTKKADTKTAKKVDAKVEAKVEKKLDDKVAPPPEKKPDAPPPVDPNAEKVQKAASVAKEISADPEHADDILARHGLDRDKLGDMMFEIASDPQLSTAYEAARKSV